MTHTFPLAGITLETLLTTSNLDVRSALRQRVISRTNVIPPNPSKGDRYLSTSNVAPWQNNKFMTYWDNNWTAATPEPGQVIYIESGADQGVWVFDQALAIQSFISTGVTNVQVGHTAFVDAQYGNDGTGVVNEPDLPFQTIEAAATAALLMSAPRLVWVNVGTYNPASNLMADGLDYYFTPGTIVNHAVVLFDASAASTCRVFGAASFVGSARLCNFTGANPINFFMQACGITNSLASSSVVNINGTGVVASFNILEKAETTGAFNNLFVVAAGSLTVNAADIIARASALAASSTSSNSFLNVGRILSSTNNIQELIAISGGTHTINAGIIIHQSPATVNTRAINITPSTTSVINVSAGLIGSMQLAGTSASTININASQISNTHSGTFGCVRSLGGTVNVKASRIQSDNTVAIFVDSADNTEIDCPQLGTVRCIQSGITLIKTAIITPTDLTVPYTVYLANGAYGIDADVINVQGAPGSFAIIQDTASLSSIIARQVSGLQATGAGTVVNLFGGALLNIDCNGIDQLTLEASIILAAGVAVTNVGQSFISAVQLGNTVTYTGSGRHQLTVTRSTSANLVVSLTNNSSLTLNNCSMSLSSGILMQINGAAADNVDVVIKNSYLSSGSFNTIRATGVATSVLHLTLYEVYLNTTGNVPPVLEQNNTVGYLTLNSRSSQCASNTATSGTVTAIGAIQTSAPDPYEFGGL